LRHRRIGCRGIQLREQQPERQGARRSSACSEKLADQEIPSPSRPLRTLTRAPQQQANYLRKITESLAGEMRKSAASYARIDCKDAAQLGFRSIGFANSASGNFAMQHETPVTQSDRATYLSAYSPCCRTDADPRLSEPGGLG
jgi:hypothetical protein